MAPTATTYRFDVGSGWTVAERQGFEPESGLLSNQQVNES